MSKDPVDKGINEANSTGTGEISIETVEVRTEELALISGRLVRRTDGEPALGELPGGNGMGDNQIAPGPASRQIESHEALE